MTDSSRPTVTTKTIKPELRVGREHFISVLTRHWPEVPQHHFSSVTDQPVITLDSRQVQSGDIFIARAGTRQNGVNFIQSALDAGAGLVLVDELALQEAASRGSLGESDIDAQRVIALTDLTAVFPSLVKAWAAIPDSLDVVAVTGTNGKSSVAHYVAELSEALGHPTGILGTLGVGRLGHLTETGLTTPDPLAVAGVIKALADDGCERVVLEASSHALDQGRLSALDIKVGLFTNLTRDHLDYHGSMLAYAAAKAKLFQLSSLQLAVINTDDDYAPLMMAGLSKDVRLLTLGREQGDFRVISWHPEMTGQVATIMTPEGERTLKLPLLGRFNLDNILLALATLYGRGEPLDDLVSALSSISPVAGRMERVTVENAPLVVVDFAHTPDALENALTALHDHVKGNLWSVIGCGGDRDNGKRPLMAEVAARLSQHVVITDDNPRTESPSDIRAQMIKGLPEGVDFDEVDGRKLAIEQTIANAQRDDIILIAGKGHENYQEINHVKHPFSDMEIARDALIARAQANKGVSNA